MPQITIFCSKSSFFSPKIVSFSKKKGFPKSIGGRGTVKGVGAGDATPVPFGPIDIPSLVALEFACYVLSEVHANFIYLLNECLGVVHNYDCIA